MAVFRLIKSLLLGAPLDTKIESHERLNTALGLAIFASDALSSSAYATDEILIALVGMLSAGAAAADKSSEVGVDLSNLYLCVPVAFAIVLLLAIVIVSYPAGDSCLS